MKNAVVRWKQRQTETIKGRPNPRFKRPMQIENVVEVGEGPHFVHIFVQPGPLVPGLPSLLEVNLNSEDIESVTLFEIETAVDNTPVLLDADGNPVGVEAQTEEQPPVTGKAAGASPVDPAISENRMSDDDEIRHQQQAGVV